MRTRTLWLALLATAGLAAMALAPSAVRAQFQDAPVDLASSVYRLQMGDVRPDLPPTVFRGQMDLGRGDPEIPVPLGHDRYEEGGLFVNFGWVMYKQTNPLKGQLLARRGFVDTDGSVTALQRFDGTPIQGTGRQGAFIGSATPALDVNQLGGPGTYTPGWRVGLGWRFRDGSSVELDWTQMFNTHYNHTATFVPPQFRFGPDLADGFLTAPVFNFPNAFAGPANKVSQFNAVGNVIPLGNPFAIYGIWNGAALMSIDLIQRYSQGDLTYRTAAICETDDYRMYGLVGPRFAWIWERFRWRTVSEDVNGNAGPQDVAIYTNIVSNRMYGAFLGVGQDWWLGHGFSVSLDLKAALLLDIVKERATYELGVKDTPPQSKRSITDYTVVPQLQGTLNLSYNPIEAVQLRLGYDVMAFFNTKASSKPVTFDWGGIDPAFNHEFIRFFDGFEASVGFVF
jgi:hypothetical protein